MNNPKRYTITAALPYANGPLHIGHIAGAYLPADIFARYLRLCKRDVVFVCGSDEHGAAITLKAKKDKVSPQEIVDKYNNQIKNAFVDFGINFDIYYRTSEPLHHKTASDYFLTLLEKDVFEVKTSEQYYDEEAEQFLADRYITGTCPKCGFENAYGDQCENCGSTLSSQDLINPRSTLSGTLPVMRETSHWFLPLQNHETWLREWLENGTLNGVKQHNPSKWKKQVLGQCKSWIDGGLQPRAMTRDLDWGVKVPVEGADGKVLYVWLDAPIGYISATKAWAERENKDWKKYWQDPETELVHFIGKDNIVFHCIIFPVLLKAHGDYILPTNVPANEFLNLEGKKISTSRNWAVWVHEYLEDFPGQQDELRYVLNAISPEFRDSEFTWADYQARVNNELVAVLGNFVNRALVLTHKFFDGKVPSGEGVDLNELAKADCAAEVQHAAEDIAKFIEAYRFRDAQQAMMGLARFGNKVLTETEPWKLAKTDLPKAEAILNFCLQLSANLTVIAAPFLPNTCAKLGQMLNTDFTEWKDAGTLKMLAVGHDINTPELLFKRIEDEEVEAQKAKLQASLVQNTKKESSLMPQKSAIEFDDFMKIDIRTATILEAERVPKTDKLMKILLDTGLDKRTVVSGIAEHYKAEELPGKQVSVLMNLEPRKIKGVESQGMILMAEDADGKLSFMSPTTEMPNGSTVR
ncbi:methionine--tRNA ligase [Cryomorpha ignava]|uniref:Methionine--tRNA ligase n=1 Tax=Cryomorpha ignava TaxID=101383 RepID=A0A7K3WSX3_9FLAO|nr:methionine--tRNA ligase [Cryomorpha ignava]NEN24556.1 methionine--tRNA ligase [Cryomorpha ignava]